LGAVNRFSQRATNCCQVIFDEPFQTSRKNGLDRLADCSPTGASVLAAAPRWVLTRDRR
jgi:hypothetical protein